MSPAPGGRPLRILMFANFDRRRRQTFFYNVDQKLYRGFIRLGHLVLGFSDRDTARAGAPAGCTGDSWTPCPISSPTSSSWATPT